VPCVAASKIYRFNHTLRKRLIIGWISEACVAKFEVEFTPDVNISNKPSKVKKDASWKK
jgi:hypothetical protein